MKTFEYNKLVRDNTLESIEQDGGFCEYKLLSAKEKLLSLIVKLQEEITELLAATNKQEQTDELADVMEVLSAYATELDISQHAIAESRADKYNRRGGFSKGIFVTTASFPKGSKYYEYCLDNSDRYKVVAENN